MSSIWEVLDIPYGRMKVPMPNLDVALCRHSTKPAIFD